jgi:hypothetical protein
VRRIENHLGILEVSVQRVRVEGRLRVLGGQRSYRKNKRKQKREWPFPMPCLQ